MEGVFFGQRLQLIPRFFSVLSRVSDMRQLMCFSSLFLLSQMGDEVYNGNGLVTNSWTLIPEQFIY